MKRIAIFGAGPAGLYCASQLIKSDFQVTIYEKTSALAKKFLIAGSSGLNITHNEEFDKFISRYGKDREVFSELIKDFSPSDLRKWCKELGIETFVGTSQRIFPKTMTAAQILKSWKAELKKSPHLDIINNAEFINFSPEKVPLCKINGKLSPINADYYLFALGGASWKSTGSTGEWLESFNDIGVETIPFQPMNCGFLVNWSEHFKDKIDNDHLKNIVLNFSKVNKRCEIMLTKYGIEGSGVYAFSREIRDQLSANKEAIIEIDLIPDLDIKEIEARLSKPRKKASFSTFLKKSLKLTKTEFILLKELTSAEEFKDSKTLAKKIKSLQIKVIGTRPMDEAISTSGGVSMSEVEENLSLKKYPHIFLMGEMLDWDAPTGGYLLQGCFSMAHRVSNALKSHQDT